MVQRLREGGGCVPQGRPEWRGVAQRFADHPYRRRELGPRFGPTLCNLRSEGAVHMRRHLAEQCGRQRAWEAKLARLAAYKEAHGDCSVPQRWAEDPQLGKWVSDQRARKRKLDRGDPSPGMTAERAAKLEALGFAWQTLAARRRPAAGVGSGVGAKRKRSAARVTEEPAGRRRRLGRGRCR